MKERAFQVVGIGGRGQVAGVAVEEFHPFAEVEAQVGAGEIAQCFLRGVGVGVAVDSAFGGDAEVIGTGRREGIERSHALLEIWIGREDIESQAGGRMVDNGSVVDRDLGIVTASGQCEEKKR